MNERIEKFNRTICEKLRETSLDLSKIEGSYTLNAPAFYMKLCNEIPSLDKKTPKERVYECLAKLIVSSTNPFIIIDGPRLKRISSAYKHILQLISDDAIRDLAIHHFHATEDNQKNLERISRNERLRKKY